MRTRVCISSYRMRYAFAQWPKHRSFSRSTTIFVGQRKGHFFGEKVVAIESPPFIRTFVRAVCADSMVSFQVHGGRENDCLDIHWIVHGNAFHLVHVPRRTTNFRRITNKRVSSSIILSFNNPFDLF